MHKIVKKSRKHLLKRKNEQKILTQAYIDGIV